MKPAVFLDRDGTIIEDRGHLGTPSEAVFYPETVRALGRLQERFLLFVVTHQPGISRGIVSAEEVARVNRYVVAELRKHGVVISEVYCCPHRRDEQCGCIKPNPYFLQAAAGKYDLDLTCSFVVGDHPHDVALAENAGAVGIYVLSGHGAKHRKELPPRTTVVPGVREAAEWILAYREMQRQEQPLKLAVGESVVELRENNGASVKRLFVVPAAVLIQMCLGGVYAWSAFVPSLRTAYGLSASQTQFIFGSTIATFAVAMVFAGRLLTRWSPRWVGLLGGLLFACGHMIAAASGGRFSGLVLGFGLVGGASLGFGYVASLTTSIQWFPKHKGLVTGVAVAGFGMGAVLLPMLTMSWLQEGWTVLRVFRAIGWIYGLLVCLVSLLLFRPPAGMTRTVVNLNVGLQLVKDPAFRVLGLGMFCGTFSGLLVIGILKPIGIARGLSPGAAAAAIGALAVGNGVGRIAWGWISDRIGYPAIPRSLLFLCLALCALIAAGLAPITFMVATILVGFGFGACFVLYAAQVAARYGVSEVGRVYPLLFLTYGMAGITGPLLGGLLHDWTGSYTWPIAVGAAVAAAGAWWTGRCHS